MSERERERGRGRERWREEGVEGMNDRGRGGGIER